MSLRGFDKLIKDLPEKERRKALLMALRAQPFKTRKTKRLISAMEKGRPTTT